MKSIYLVVIAIICNTLLAAQNNGRNKIVGVLYEKIGAEGKRPLAGASVSIPGLPGSTVSDGKGYYSIDLSHCSSCTAGETVKIYVNSKIGYAEREYVIPTNPDLKPFDIEIAENKKLALNGIVRDKVTGKFLKGIKVTVVIPNYELTIPSAITDDDGNFQIIIRKEGIVSMQAIQLTFSDADDSKYKDLEKVVFINQYEPVKVEMEECVDCGSRQSLDVNTYLKSDIKVDEGDLVTIKASGVIRVGSFVGNSGPEGVPNNKGVLGMSLEQYNYFSVQNHAVLFFRFGENDEWKFYTDKKENKYIAQASGYLEFGINDNQQGDNSGSYQVDVIIRK